MCTEAGFGSDIGAEGFDKLAEALFSHAVDFYIGRLPEDMDAKSVTMRPPGVEPVTMIAPCACRCEVA